LRQLHAAKDPAEQGYDVVTAADGQRGMTVFRSETPDVVIIDIITPEQVGIETIAQIRNERSEVKIIAISGGARIRNVDFLEMAYSQGADEIFCKPFEAEALLSRLSQWGSQTGVE
jgi:DNA-binding response OmpR family regulator